MAVQIKTIVISQEKGSDGYIASWNYNNSGIKSKKVVIGVKGKKKTYKTYSADASVSNFIVRWDYRTSDGIWVLGDEQTIDTWKKQSTYSPPSNATHFRFYVKAASSSYTYTVYTKKKGKWKTKSSTKKTFFSCSWSPVKSMAVNAYNDPETPSAPEVELNNLKLTCTVAGIADTNTSKIEFQIVKDDITQYQLGTADVDQTTNTAIWGCNLPPDGGKYKVRCRAINSANERSEWSSYSSEVETNPGKISTPPTLQVRSVSSVLVSWDAVNNADHYTIAYATNEEDLDREDNSYATVDTPTSGTSYTLTGLTSGYTYYVRVCAVASGGGKGEWSDISTAVLGTKPTAPTTWSSATVVAKGDTVKLYWIHNSEDNSIEDSSNLVITLDGREMLNETIKNEAKDDYDNPTNKTHIYELDTSTYKDGAELKWKVRTKGVLPEYGDFSIERSINVYEKPSLILNLSNTEEGLDNPDEQISELGAFPLYIKATAAPATQIANGFHISITSQEAYDGENPDGSEREVRSGDEVYNKYFVTNIDYENPIISGNAMILKLSAGDLDLEPNVTYELSAIAEMDSGLNAVQTALITPTWEDVVYYPTADIFVDPVTMTAEITPYCVEGDEVPEYGVQMNSDTDYLTLELLTYDELVGEKNITFNGENTGRTYKGFEVIFADLTDKVQLNFKTESSEDTALNFAEDTIYKFRTDIGYALYLGEATENTVAANVTLAVYRQEANGNLLEIASGIENTADESLRLSVVDPHPSLDEARYRIVATSIDTGAVGYTDVSEPVGETSIYIQWDEKWNDVYNDDPEQDERPAWSGTLLELLYNVDVSDAADKDVALVEYIGRTRPVSYYGTQLGEKPSWSAEIPKDDKETIRLLRQLNAYMGSVYVREPSGTGYWAEVSVSFSQQHCKVTVPVTINVNPVEGGI